MQRRLVPRLDLGPCTLLASRQWASLWAPVVKKGASSFNVDRRLSSWHVSHDCHVKAIFRTICGSDAFVDRDHAAQPTHGPALEGQPHGTTEGTSCQGGGFCEIFMAVVHHGQLPVPKGRRQRVKVVAPNGINLVCMPIQPSEEFPLQRRIEQGASMRFELSICRPAKDLAKVWNQATLGPRAPASTQGTPTFHTSS